LLLLDAAAAARFSSWHISLSFTSSVSVFFHDMDLKWRQSMTGAHRHIKNPDPFDVQILRAL
jgi:hypothetical protein